MASSGPLLLTFLSAALVQPESNRKHDYPDGNSAGNFSRAHEVVLNDVPVVAGAKRQERNEREPHRGGGGDSEHYRKRGKLHCPRERRHDRAHSRQESAHEEPAEAVTFVEFLDPLLS